MNNKVNTKRQRFLITTILISIVTLYLSSCSLIHYFDDLSLFDNNVFDGEKKVDPTTTTTYPADFFGITNIKFVAANKDLVPKENENNIVVLSDEVYSSSLELDISFIRGELYYLSTSSPIATNNSSSPYKHKINIDFPSTFYLEIEDSSGSIRKSYQITIVLESELLHVSATANGDDDNNDGSSKKPFKTITKALLVAGARTTNPYDAKDVLIWVDKNGICSSGETINPNPTPAGIGAPAGLGKSITIEGGYNYNSTNGEWTLDSSARSTYSADLWLGTNLTATVKNFTITKGLKNESTLTLSNCIIKSDSTTADCVIETSGSLTSLTLENNSEVMGTPTCSIAIKNDGGGVVTIKDSVTIAGVANCQQVSSICNAIGIDNNGGTVHMYGGVVMGGYIVDTITSGTPYSFCGISNKGAVTISGGDIIGLEDNLVSYGYNSGGIYGIEHDSTGILTIDGGNIYGIKDKVLANGEVAGLYVKNSGTSSSAISIKKAFIYGSYNDANTTNKATNIYGIKNSGSGIINNISETETKIVGAFGKISASSIYGLHNQGTIITLSGGTITGLNGNATISDTSGQVCALYQAGTISSNITGTTFIGAKGSIGLDNISYMDGIYALRLLSTSATSYNLNSATIYGVTNFNGSAGIVAICNEAPSAVTLKGTTVYGAHESTSLKSVYGIKNSKTININENSKVYGAYGSTITGSAYGIKNGENTAAANLNSTAEVYGAYNSNATTSTGVESIGIVGVNSNSKVYGAYSSTTNTIGGDSYGIFSSRMVTVTSGSVYGAYGPTDNPNNLNIVGNAYGIYNIGGDTSPIISMVQATAIVVGIYSATVANSAKGIYTFCDSSTPTSSITINSSTVCGASSGAKITDTTGDSYGIHSDTTAATINTTIKTTSSAPYNNTYIYGAEGGSSAYRAYGFYLNGSGSKVTIDTTSCTTSNTKIYGTANFSTADTYGAYRKNGGDLTGDSNAYCQPSVP